MHRGTHIGRMSWEDDEADAATHEGKPRTASKLEARRGAGREFYSQPSNIGNPADNSILDF